MLTWNAEMGFVLGNPPSQHGWTCGFWRYLEGLSALILVGSNVPMRCHLSVGDTN